MMEGKGSGVKDIWEKRLVGDPKMRGVTNGKKWR